MRVCLPGFLGLALLAGCGQDSVRVYRVPKEKTPSASASPAESPGKPHLHWDLPAGWQEEPAGGMRAASFSIPSQKGQAIDVSVIPLAGQSGSELDNVNRWRSQLRLPPVDASELSRQAEGLKLAGVEGHLYELLSEEPLLENTRKVRVLAAIAPRGNTTWFFKMTGEDSEVQAQKAAFKEFLSSVSIHEGDEHGSPAETAALPAPTENASGDAPAGWREAAAPPMVQKQFLIEEAGAKAAVSVSVLQGDAGGLLANVNRWRVQQLGLPAVKENELAGLTRSFDVAGGKATLVEMDGTDSKTGQKARMIVAIVSRGGQTWFYKLMGDESLVAREKEKLITFVQTVRN